MKYGDGLLKRSEFLKENALLGRSWNDFKGWKYLDLTMDKSWWKELRMKQVKLPCKENALTTHGKLHIQIFGEIGAYQQSALYLIETTETKHDAYQILDQVIVLLMISLIYLPLPAGQDFRMFYILAAQLQQKRSRRSHFVSGEICSGGH